MARGGGDREQRRRVSKDAGRRTKKKVCMFCKEHIDWVDYKDVNLLRRFMSDRGKIRARRVSGNCAQHQRDVAVAIKTARELALLPYTQRTTAERGAPRRSAREAPAVVPQLEIEELAEGEEPAEVADLVDASVQGDGEGAPVPESPVDEESPALAEPDGESS